jgi:hypothetical protein
VLDRSPQTASHDAEQIHEHVFTQQLVDFGFTRVVTARELANRVRFTMPKMKHVQVRELGATFHDAIDHRFERAFLFARVRRPESLILRRPRLAPWHEVVHDFTELEQTEQVIEPAPAHERIALQVQEQIAGFR